MIFLLLSFVVASLMHGCIVYAGRKERPETLSTHAVLTKRSLLYYKIGHLVNGLLIGLMVNSLFLGGAHNNLIVAVTILSVASEWLQAFIPAKGKTDIAHTIIAAIMSFSMMVLVLLVTIDFAPNNKILWFNTFWIAVLFCFTSLVRYPPKSYFWKLQLFGQTVLYLLLFLLVY